ncbi:hypothetical protein EJ110_NYTH07145 [Nymphaea thermarum]|nr:hypothetical protein EJ110_NYTH07145 [Nymphaea thermarum]
MPFWHYVSSLANVLRKASGVLHVEEDPKPECNLNTPGSHLISLFHKKQLVPMEENVKLIQTLRGDFAHGKIVALFQLLLRPDRSTLPLILPYLCRRNSELVMGKP